MSEHLVTDPTVGTRQVDIPQGAADDAKSMRRYTDQEVVNRINEFQEESENHSRSRRDTFDRNYLLYLSRFNFSGKAAWQSKAPIPRMFNLLENACALFGGALMPGARWFAVEDTWETDETRALMLERLMRTVVGRMGLDSLLRPILLAGMIGGMAPVKVGVDNSGNVPYPSIELWDPRDVYLDFTGRGRFIIADTEIDPYVLEDWADAGMFDKGRVAEALASERGEGVTGDFDHRSKSLHWREFWGDLPDKDGKAIARNAHAVVVNKRVLVRPLIDNPFNHSRFPFLLSCPLRVPYKVYQQGLAEHVAGLVLMLTELANNVLDATLFSSVQAYLYDVDQIDPGDVRRGIWPGRAIPVNDLEATRPGLMSFEAGKVPMDAMSIGQWLQQEVGYETGISENATGIETPGSRRKTAREVVTRTGQSMGIIRTMARDEEITFLEPLLDMALSVFAQVTSRSPRAFFSPEMLKALGDQAALMMAALDSETRAELLTRGVRFQAFGVSGQANLNEDLQRLLGMAETLSRDPEMWSQVRKRRLAERIVEAHRMIPDDVLLSEAEVQARQQAAQAQMAAMAAAGSASPPGGPPAPPSGGPPPPPEGGLPSFLRAAQGRMLPPVRPPRPGQPRALPRLSPQVVLNS